jgi:transcriptional regulator with XRE-family HTH domain
MPKRPVPKKLAKKLTQIRKNLGLSQTEIVKALKYKGSPLRASQISNFEHGKREPPTMLLLAYARLAEISTDVLIDDDLDLMKRL